MWPWGQSASQSQSQGWDSSFPVLKWQCLSLSLSDDPNLAHLFTSIPLAILWTPEAPQRPQTDFYAGNNRREKFGGLALEPQGSGVLESLCWVWEQEKNSISNDERKSLGKIFMTSQRQLEWPSDRLFHHSYFLVFYRTNWLTDC